MPKLETSNKIQICIWLSKITASLYKDKNPIKTVLLLYKIKGGKGEGIIFFCLYRYFIIREW